MQEFQYKHLAPTLEVLWPDATEKAYALSLQDVESEALSSPINSVQDAHDNMKTATIHRGLVDNLGVPLPNTLESFPRILEKLEFNPVDLPREIPGYLSNPQILSRKIIRGASVCTTGDWCEIIAAGGFQIGHSCWIVKTQSATVVIDFGMDPMSDQVPPWCPEIGDIDAVLLSHLHGDHAGGLFHLVEKLHFRGPIYAAALNQKFADLILLDALTNQERDFLEASQTPKEIQEGWLARVTGLLSHFAFIPEKKNWIEVAPKIEVMFLDAGHVPGSSSFLLRINDSKTLYFTNDCNPSQSALPHAMKYPNLSPDYVFCEGTYAIPREGAHPDPKTVLVETAREADGFLLIPAISLGRAQEVLQVLVDEGVSHERRIIATGLAGRVTQRLLGNFLPRNLDIRFQTYARIPKIRKDYDILVASNGFLNGGPSRAFYDKYNTSENPLRVLLTGYCPVGSLASHLLKTGGAMLARFSAHASTANIHELLGRYENAEKIFMAHTPHTRHELRENFPNVTVPRVLGRIKLW